MEDGRWLNFDFWEASRSQAWGNVGGEKKTKVIRMKLTT